VIKSRWVGWVGHSACLRERRNAYEILVRKFEGKRPLSDLGTKGRTILNCMLYRSMMTWAAFIWLRIGISCWLM
jgi:hypothetical protein